MSYSNRTSLDTDVIFLRSVFMFSTGTTNYPVPQNYVLASGSNGYMSAQNPLLVISSIDSYVAFLPSTISTLNANIISTGNIYLPSTQVNGAQLISTTNSLLSTISTTDGNLNNLSTYLFSTFFPQEASSLSTTISELYSTITSTNVSPAQLNSTSEYFLSSISTTNGYLEGLSTNTGNAGYVTNIQFEELSTATFSAIDDTDENLQSLQNRVNIDYFTLYSLYLNLSTSVQYSSLTGWSYIPAVSTVNMNANSIKDIFEIIGSTCRTDGLNGFQTALGQSTYTSGIAAHAEGIQTSAIGHGSHTEGYASMTFSQYAHAEGYSTFANAEGTHTEGILTGAYGLYSHAEGEGSVAIGRASHAEGLNTSSFGSYSHTFGTQTLAFGLNSIAAGINSVAFGTNSFAIGTGISSIGANSIVAGFNSSNIGSNTFAIGENCFANGPNSLSHGNSNISQGDHSHAEGSLTFALFSNAHAEGFSTLAYGVGSHTEGSFNFAYAGYSHAEGNYNTTNTLALYSHVEGQGVQTFGVASHAEGQGVQTIGFASHAEGLSTISGGIASHAEGAYTSTIGNYSHSEGLGTTSFGIFSHAEGLSTLAVGNGSHAEGENTTSAGYGSHAEGAYTESFAKYTHAEGIGSRAYQYASKAYATGMFNNTKGSAQTWQLNLYNSTIGTNQATLIYGVDGLLDGAFTTIPIYYNTRGYTTSFNVDLVGYEAITAAASNTNQGIYMADYKFIAFYDDNNESLCVRHTGGSITKGTSGSITANSEINALAGSPDVTFGVYVSDSVATEGSIQILLTTTSAANINWHAEIHGSQLIRYG